MSVDLVPDEVLWNLVAEAQAGRLNARDMKVLMWQREWQLTRREKQTPPPDPWSEWGILSGRGWGKSLTGAQWIAIEAVTDPEALPSFVIAPTLNDIRYTCFEGHTGILSIIPAEIVKDYNRTNLIITLDNGATIRGFSAEEPERLRGPQACRAWCDEIAAWAQGEETWNMMSFGLRLGPHPKVVWTTTPKPKELIRNLVEPKLGRVITSGTTYENRANLPQSFFDQLAQYEGTQLGRQELLAEIIDAEEGGIIARSWIRRWPHDKPLPAFAWIVMSLDTAFTEKTIDRKSHDPDPTACGVFGVFEYEDRSNVILLDAWEAHMGFPDLIRRTKKELKATYGPDRDAPMIKPMFGPKRLEGAGKSIDLVIIEDKGSGISLRQALEREGISAYAYNPGNADKAARLHMVSHLFNNRQIWVPGSGNPDRRGQFVTWADKAVAQLCAYRGAGSIKHDDFVDVFSQALRVCMDKGLLTTVPRTRQIKAEKEQDEKTAARGPRINPYAA